MPKQEFDIFHNERIYKDADQIFSIKLSTLNDIKDNCIYVLDTNALLVPYSTGSQSLKEIGEIFTKLKTQKRLLIPSQVAREFTDNRPKKLGEMYHALSQKRDSQPDMTIGRYPLLEDNAEYKEALELEKQLRELTKTYRETIGKLSDTVRNWTWDDPVSQIYRDIFTPDLIYKLKTAKEKIKEDLDYRYLHKIPPGYKDNGKEDDGIGDLLIWLSILEIAKQKRNVVFVSADVKSDWYYKINKIPLYPRFELLAEFQKESANHSFHIIRLSELLKVMGAHDEVVSEVKMEEEFDFTKIPQVFPFMAELAVVKWYKQKYTSVIYNPEANDPRNKVHIEYHLNDEIKVGVIISLAKGSLQLTIEKVRHDLKKMLEYTRTNDSKIRIEMVIVAQSENYPFHALHMALLHILSRVETTIVRFTCNIGYLDKESRFFPVFENVSYNQSIGH